MRLSHSNNLYYPLTSSVPSKSRPFSLTLALGEMVPIRPRRQIVYPNDLSINIPGKDVMEERPLYTLYHTNRKLSMEPKVCTDTCTCIYSVGMCSVLDVQVHDNIAICMLIQRYIVF